MLPICFHIGKTYSEFGGKNQLTNKPEMTEKKRVFYERLSKYSDAC